MNRLLSAIVLLFVCAFVVGAEDEHIWLDAKINDQPVRLLVDTGLGAPYLLYSTAADRLGLKYNLGPTNTPLAPGQAAGGWTDPCKLDLGLTNVETQFAVMQVPSYLRWPEDGVVGWSAISNNLFIINCVKHVIQFLTNATHTSTEWVAFHLRGGAGALTLDWPGENGASNTCVIDSGFPAGVILSPQKWREWKAKHPRQPASMDAYYLSSWGAFASEEIWAPEIYVGSLKLTDVPVMEENPHLVDLYSSAGTQYQARLGFAALKRLYIIIDGKEGLAYLQPRPTPALPYEHNRLGAAFVPRAATNDDLVAYVAEGSPAQEAGIRNQDVLLKIGDLDAAKWRTDPKVLPLGRFWNGPAGTKLELTLKRGKKVFKVTAVLRNILPPDPPKKSG